MKHQSDGVDKDERLSVRMVRSTPTVIERHHSVPNFVSNRWGNVDSRRSYDCLTKLGAQCSRTRRCKSCKKLPEVGALNKSCCKGQWWGMFLDLSNVGSDDWSRTSTEASTTPLKAEERPNEVAKK
ncbi:hypothetical protein ACHAXH_006665 [Discostella pseudostelligera]